MATVIINDKPVDIGNEKLNLVQAAARAGVLIPSYCWHPALTVVASCRMCLVEVGEKKPDGSVAMQPRVVPACQTPAKDGTVVVTHGERAKFAQQQTLESLLLNHPLDCPVCDKAGECLLQDFTYKFGRAESRMIEAKNQPPNKPHIGEHITLFTDRCIMCSRCVRFTREISGTAELHVINRGNHSEIDVFPGEPCNNKLAGNVVDLCPVGALCNKDFLYKQRVWFMKSQKSVCGDCSTGCSIVVDQNKDIIYRLRPRDNPQAQGHFMCDEGRFGFHYVHAAERLRQPRVCREQGQAATTWEETFVALRREFAAAATKDAGSVAAVLSPFLTCEEAYLIAKYFKGLSQQVRLALGPIPVVGADDHYPKDRHGKSIEPVRFTIRAEKCPNRKGVEAVLRHFQGEVIGFDDILRGAADGRVKALYIAAGYPPRTHGAGNGRGADVNHWISAEQTQSLKSLSLLVVSDLFASPASALATHVLPAAAFAEKDGTFVNHAGLAQAIHMAVRPAHDCRSEGRIMFDLSERRGLMHAATIRAELAKEVPYFAPLAGDLGDHGVFLK